MRKPYKNVSAAAYVKKVQERRKAVRAMEAAINEAGAEGRSWSWTFVNRQAYTKGL